MHTYCIYLYISLYISVYIYNIYIYIYTVYNIIYIYICVCTTNCSVTVPQTCSAPRGAGKTSILRRFVEGVEPGTTLPTIGVDVETTLGSNGFWSLDNHHL